MTHTFIAAQYETNGGHWYACEITITNEHDNIMSVLADRGPKTAMICNTKKKCAEVVKAWNDSHREQGRLLYDAPEWWKEV